MIEKLRKDDFDKVYRLMEISFPKEEYRPYEKQTELFGNGAYEIYCIYDTAPGREDDIKAFISVWDFGEFAYAEHFAVNPDYRNGGLGSLMIRELCGSIGKMLCLEVEPPVDEITRSRIDFYRSSGFFLNEYPYIQPPFADGYDEIPLMIMTSGRLITPDEFENIKNTLYRSVYGKEI